MSAMLAVEAGVQNARRLQRKSRRREETVLTDEARNEGRKRIRRTTINSRQKKTRTTYSSYRNSIHEWYAINRREVCNDRGELMFDQIYQNCMDLDKLYEEAESFKDFLNARTHIRKFQDAAKTIPAKASVGTLMGFRSAFNYYVWTERDSSTGIPYEWNQCLKGCFQGLKNGE